MYDPRILPAFIMISHRSVWAVSIAFMLCSSTAFAAGSDAAGYEAYDVESLLQSLSIREPISDLKAMAASSDGKHHGFAFSNGKYAKVFRDGAMVYSGDSGMCFMTAFLFRMTEDGHLLYSRDCSSLYVDDQKVFEENNVLAYGQDSVTYENGTLYYPYGDDVMAYDIAKKKGRALYSHPKTQVLYLRKDGKYIAYSVLDSSGRAFLYLNGKKVSSVKISNPSNFLLTRKGDVYYFTEQNTRYSVYKNKGKFFTGAGKSGFLFDDGQNNAWHVSYIDGDAFELFLYKGSTKKNLFPSDVGNAEGYMVFQEDAFAGRVLKKGTSDDFYLMKNGKTVGSKFSFASLKDYNGPFFGEDGKVYMRNFDGTRWQASQDGKVILRDEFENVWLVMKQSDGKAAVFGTK